MTRIYDDSGPDDFDIPDYEPENKKTIPESASQTTKEIQEQKPVETYNSNLLEQIGNLRMRIEQLEKTVKGLCNIQKENWENFYKAVVEKEGKI